MSLGETDVEELASQDHDVLGSDFCSGYTDIFGKWNTGFDCPRVGNGETVYCCGTVAYKYCCTRRDQHAGTNISQSVLLGSALGSVLMIVLVTLVSCFLCRRCPPYRRQHPSLNGGPLYAMHCSSTASGMANLYSFSGQPSTVTSPLDSHCHLVDIEGGYAVPRVLGRHLSLATPTDPPPPYVEADHSNPPASDSFDLRTAPPRQSPANHPSPEEPGCEGAANQNPAYWCTKF